jgi:chromosome segregation ATPase
VLPAIGALMIGWALTQRKRIQDRQILEAKHDAANDDMLAKDANELRQLYREQKSEMKDLQAKVELLTNDKAAMKAKAEIAESDAKALREMLTTLNRELELERDARKRALEEAQKRQHTLDLRNDEVSDLVESVRKRDVEIAALRVTLDATKKELVKYKGMYTQLAQYVAQHMPQHKDILKSVIHDTGEFTVTDTSK